MGKETLSEIWMLLDVFHKSLNIPGLLHINQWALSRLRNTEPQPESVQPKPSQVPLSPVNSDVKVDSSTNENTEISRRL